MEISVYSILFYIVIVASIVQIVYNILPFRVVILFKFFKNDYVISLLLRDLTKRWIPESNKIYIINYIVRHNNLISLENMKKLKTITTTLILDTKIKNKQLYKTQLNLILFFLVSKGIDKEEPSQLQKWLLEGKEILSELDLIGEDKINLSLHFIKNAIDLKQFDDAKVEINNIKKIFTTISEEQKNYLLFYEALLLKGIGRKDDSFKLLTTVNNYFRKGNTQHLLFKIFIQKELGEYFEEVGELSNALANYKETLILIAEVPSALSSEKLINLEKNLKKKISRF
jgi:hypothetical protein